MPDWRDGERYHPAQGVCGPYQRPKRTPEEEAAHRQKMTKLAHWLWSETALARGTLVEVYLWSRLLTMAPPSSLRLHYGVRLDEIGKLPAMVGKVEHIEHGFTAVHCTFLHPDYHGGAPRRGARKTFGPIGGGAVRFGWPKPDRWLAVAEGIETTLSVALSEGVPGWAALSARGIVGLKLPPDARQILIAADADGRRAARIASERWLAEGRRVRILTPPTPGSDWNDVLIGRAPASHAMGETDAA